MSDGVQNNQPANEDTFNNAFMKSGGNTGTTGKMDLTNGLAESGSFVLNVQRNINSIFSFAGGLINQAKDYLPTFTNNNGFTATQSLYERVNEISLKFDQLLGHTHSGVAGDGPQLDGSAFGAVPLRGYPIAAADIDTPGANDTDVSSYLIGKVPSSGVAVKGVVVTAPYNKILLFVKDGANANDSLVDSLGNVVYGRLTYSLGVWTLTTYVDLSGVETAYALTVGQITDGIKWFYQELFSPIEDAPTYNELFFVQSDNATADVVDASSTQRGLINTLAQSFSGLKTFINGLSANNQKIINVLDGVDPTDAVNKSQLNQVDDSDVLVDVTKVDGVVVDFEHLHETILSSDDTVEINKLT